MAQPSASPDPGPSAALGRELDRLVGAQLAHVRRRFLVHGLATTLLLPALVVAGAFLLDHSLHLPAPIRLFHSLVAIAVVAYAVRRWLHYPLTRPWSPTDVALLVERSFPELHERLVSAIQLKGALDGGDAQALRNQSPAMIEQLLAETAAQARALPFARMFDRRRTGRMWGAAATLMLLLLAGAVAAPETAAAFLWRHLGHDVGYPRATQLVVELPAAGPELQRVDRDGYTELVVPAGADLHVSVLANGVVPDEVFLDVRGQGGERSVAAAPRPGGRFRHVFRGIASAFEFHARGGDDDYGDRRVAVRTIHAPLVAQIKAELVPPAYTQKPPAVQTGGAVEALIGTQVSLAVVATAAVREATLVFLESGARVPLQLQRSTDDAGTVEAFVGGFLVTASDRYQVELVGDGGLRNPNPGTYPVTALQDYAPVGRWLLPDDESSTPLLPEAILCVRLEARDDFGLASGTLQIDAGAGRTESRPLLAVAQGAVPPQERLCLDLIEVKQLLGEQRSADGLSLQVDLHDNRQPQPNITQLPRRQVQIVDQTQLAAAIARHFRGLREEVEQTLDLQNDRRTRLHDLLALSPAPGAATAQVLTAIEVGQGRIQSASERLVRGAMRAFDLHLWNRLEPSPGAAIVVEFYREWHAQNGTATAYQPQFYREVQERRRTGAIPAMERSLDPILAMTLLCDRLATELSPPVLRLLAQAQVARGAADLEQDLRATVELQDRIAAVLQELLLRLDEWNDYQDLVQAARALREQQQDVQHRTEALRGGK